MIWLLAVLSFLYAALALASLVFPFPFEAIAWTGLILICAWAWVDAKEMNRADRTRTVVG